VGESDSLDSREDEPRDARRRVATAYLADVDREEVVPRQKGDADEGRGREEEREVAVGDETDGVAPHDADGVCLARRHTPSRDDERRHAEGVDVEDNAASEFGDEESVSEASETEGNAAERTDAPVRDARRQDERVGDGRNRRVEDGVDGGSGEDDEKGAVEQRSCGVREDGDGGDRRGGDQDLALCALPVGHEAPDGLCHSRRDGDGSSDYAHPEPRHTDVFEEDVTERTEAAERGEVGEVDEAVPSGFLHASNCRGAFFGVVVATGALMSRAALVSRMPYRRFKGGREYLLRLEKGRDWRGQIENFADEEGIDAAWFNGMGAATDATVWFYDQETEEYVPKGFDEPFEVAMAVGNVSFLDGERFAHTHVLLTREDGSTVGGHLDSATAFAGEVYVRELEGRVEREHDAETDLDLWSDGSLDA